MSIVTTLPSSTSTPVSSPTASAAASSSDASKSSGGSSPLLFFVALGFGVIFANLWIIVGVKFCFRYRSRRRLAQNGGVVDETVIGMHDVPPRVRRRREKKLLTMDEVEERFPSMKYKAWKALRERQGLSSEGGVDPQTARNASRPSSRPNSPPASRAPTRAPSRTPSRAPSRRTPSRMPSFNQSRGGSRAPSLHDVELSPPSIRLEEADFSRGVDNEESMSTEERLQEVEGGENGTAAPDEVGPGDACAICIDALEDDENVRGLTCGHAFHAGCIDPWLTSRKACCPLCKADFFIPKTSQEEADAQPEEAHQARSGSNRLMLTYLSRIGLPPPVPPLQEHTPPYEFAPAAAPETSTSAPSTRSWWDFRSRHQDTDDQSPRDLEEAAENPVTTERSRNWRWPLRRQREVDRPHQMEDGANLPGDGQ